MCMKNIRPVIHPRDKFTYITFLSVRGCHLSHVDFQFLMLPYLIYSLLKSGKLHIRVGSFTNFTVSPLDKFLYRARASEPL